ncbi:hypothetical protein GCM10010458_22880 [Microbacterium luteolum]
MDFTRVSPRLFDDVELVVDELTAAALVEPECIMLVGAQCRDILHRALGHTSVTRTTGDLDFGIALADWDAFERIDRAFTRDGSSGIRYRIAGVLVDVMPFGAAIEDPIGISNPGAREEDLVVFGFEDVFEHALPIDLPGTGRKILIASPAGYAALKLRAWVDRSEYGEYKDAEDIATVLSWYSVADAVQDRIYGDEIDVTEQYGFDVDLASAHLLGRDVRGQLSTSNAEDLARRLAESETREFTSALSTESWDASRGVEVSRALQAGLAERALERG